MDRLEQRLPELAARQATLVAITSDPPDVTGRFARDQGYTMPILSDAGGRESARWGAWDSKNEAVRSAVFIVDREGTVRYRYVGESRRDHPTPAEIVTAAGRVARGELATGQPPPAHGVPVSRPK